MDLSIATHFSHGGWYSQRLFEDALDKVEISGADGVRDGMSWRAIEEQRGVYEFSDFRQNYVDSLADNDTGVSLSILPSRNPLYDNGATVHSNQGIAAFADFIVAVAKEFPELRSITIGNEHNGLNSTFVNGVAASDTIETRVAYYTNIVKAVHEALDAAGLDIDLGGGALHSMATGYVEAMIDAGTFAYIDALDFHPYGEDPVEVGNALARLNELLDTLPQNQRPDLIVTEFGAVADAGDPLSNANYLAKMAAILAEGDVSNAAWYALYDEDQTGTPDMGLYDSPERANAMLDGFRFTANLLEDADVAKRDAGPGVELYDFGNGTLLVWGSAQGVTISGGNLIFRDASGSVIEAPTRLSDAPIFIQGTGIEIDTTEGPGELLADSFYDFDLSPNATGPWSYHAIESQNGRETSFDLEVIDGQEKMNDIWNPYLGRYGSGPMRVSVDVVLPSHRATVERFTAQSDGAVDIVTSWSVLSRSNDGVVVEIRVNGETLLTETVTGDSAVVVRALDLDAGDTVDFIVHDGRDASGDITTRHIRILEADQGRTADSLAAEHLANDIIDGNEGIRARVVGAVTTDPDPQEPVIQPEPADPPEPPVLPDPFPPTEEFAEELTGTSGADRLVASSGSDGSFLDGQSGNDLLKGRGGNDLLRGGDGNDKLIARNGDDSLEGGAGRDRLNGGSGADVLNGGRGADVLNGGNGGDIFVFDTLDGRDIVTDFDVSEGDVLDLTALELAADELIVTMKGNKAVLSTDVDSVEVEIAKVNRVDISDFDVAGALLF